MTILVVLGLLFIVAGVAGIAGWGVDSRDSRFSLWPLYRAAPNEFRRRDPKRPDARRPVHVAHRTVTCRPAPTRPVRHANAHHCEEHP